MFTGLVTDIGTIDRVRDTDAGREFRVQSAYAGVATGESIAVNGTCLTVRERGDGWFTIAAVGTTSGRTTVPDWTTGRRVNLERALAVGDRFGGHFVQGHVDAVADVSRVERVGDAVLVDVRVPHYLMPLVVPHGSICIDGVSLTVNDICQPQTVQLSLIEFTLTHTTLGALRANDCVNVEADMLAKHVQRLLAANPAAATLPSSEFHFPFPV